MSDELDTNDILEAAEFDYMMETANKKLDGVSLFSTNNAPEPTKDEPKKEEDYKQWAAAGNDKFSPVGGTVGTLPAGVYEPFVLPGSWGVERLRISSDEIYELPDMATNTVIAEAETFWANEAKYRKHNLLYKRGILLHGPPGSGKTVTIKLLINKLVSRGGIVLLVHNVNLATLALKALKRIEPTRNLICIFEDIDEIMMANGEASLLSMLDGENNVDRVMNIASTNFADRLGARIINRPSRFDRRVYVGMPNDESRKYYLQKATADDLAPEQLEQWVADTKGMSVAHLRELVAAVYCLDQSYSEVIGRLKEMASQVKPDAEFKSRGLGFVGAKNTGAGQWDS